MSQLSDDDLNIRDLSDEELDLAWDLWFDLAQSTNDEDPPYTHGVFQRADLVATPQPPERSHDIANTPADNP
jgi:hypothetical protein